MTSWTLLFVAVSGLALIADGASDLSSDESVLALSKANLDYTLDLYQRLVKPDENLVMSGFSVSTVLSMLTSGARGKTSEELSTALKYNGISISALEEAFEKVLRSIEGSDDYQLSAANSVWVKKDFKILNEYKQKLAKVYHADALELTGRTDVNNWVSSKTGGYIPELLQEELSPETVIMLINAIYFNGTWETQFIDYTFENMFLNNDVDIPMDDYPAPTTTSMRVNDRFKYADSEELAAQLLELPYVGNDMSMIVVLPNYKLKVWENQHLTSENLLSAIDKLSWNHVSVVLPKFKIESTIPLVNTLKSQGVQEVFGSNSNLSGISNNALQVSNVLQKAVIEVNQQGTVAAAATSVSITGRSGFIRKYIDFRVTKPFMFALLHRPTNSFVFMGRYTNAVPYIQ